LLDLPLFACSFDLLSQYIHQARQPMNSGKLLSAFTLVLMLTSAPVFGQVTKPWVTPRTPDGHPDLQGTWNTATLTPLERPAEFADKPILTAQEAKAYEDRLLRDGNRDRREATPEADAAGAYNEFWFERGSHIVPDRRTSLVIDPPDGRIPPLTPEAQKRRAALAEYRRQHPADGPEDFALQNRCLLWGTAGPPMMPSAYNNNYQIVQGPGYVSILVEMIHDARIIPTNGSSHLPSNVRLWLGDSRGHWEGDTLVVETTNFTNKTNFRGASENMRLTERFTRVNADTINYEFTVNDPSSFTKPWSGRVPMKKSTGPVFEYACNEGNYALAGILGGARAEEKAAAEGAKKSGRQ
jgi:hypothetical protein